MARAYEAQTHQRLDARSPRDIPQQIATTEGLDAATRARFRRAEAAGANGFENFGVFAAAVTAGTAAGLDAALMNGLTLGYLVSRVAYGWFYVNGDTAGKAKARGVTYTAGMVVLFTMFVKAGSRFRLLGV
jgi:uncharacterized MAPEG superfamily protein